MCDRILGREKSIKLVQYLEIHLRGTFVLSSPLLAAMITESSSAPKSLEVRQLLVKWLRVQRETVSPPVWYAVRVRLKVNAPF
jgi:hypothetical protein